MDVCFGKLSPQIVFEVTIFLNPNQSRPNVLIVQICTSDQHIKHYHVQKIGFCLFVQKCFHISELIFLICFPICEVHWQELVEMGIGQNDLFGIQQKLMKFSFQCHLFHFGSLDMVIYTSFLCI